MELIRTGSPLSYTIGSTKTNDAHCRRTSRNPPGPRGRAARNPTQPHCTHQTSLERRSKRILNERYSVLKWILPYHTLRLLLKLVAFLSLCSLGIGLVDVLAKLPVNELGGCQVCARLMDAP